MKSTIYPTNLFYLLYSKLNQIIKTKIETLQLNMHYVIHCRAVIESLIVFSVINIVIDDRDKQQTAVTLRLNAQI